MKTTTQEMANEVVKHLTGSGYSMGDKFTLNITLKGEVVATAIYDNRQYYSGKHANRYNSNIRHGNITQTISLTELKRRYKPIADKAKFWAKYNKECNTSKFIAERVKEAVTIIKGNEADDSEGRYWIEGYKGCGVYRLAIQNGKIAAVLKGGYHNSKPMNTDKTKWVKAIDKYLFECLGDNYQLVKADGSGCSFFLREENDELETINYVVPSVTGGYHQNIEVRKLA